MLKVLYIIAIGLLLSAFIGFGINTFYPEPVSPYENREISMPVKIDSDQETKTELKQKLQVAENQKYQEELNIHAQTTSVIYLILSVITIAISLFGIGKIEVIGDGVTLGGVFSLFVGIVTSFSVDLPMYRFAAVTIGLVIVLLLSYWKFVRPADASLPPKPLP